MKASALPKAGVISNPGSGEFFGAWSDLTGKDVLCLGFSEAQVEEFVAPHEPNSVQLLAYWDDHIDAKSDKYPVTLGDITKRTDFPDKRFDRVLTYSVLEHVSDLSAAFGEMKRVTRSGGELLHIFGPVWSCAYGHHLYVDPTDPQLNFVQWQMPAHMHLLCTETEVCAYYRELGYSQDVGEFVYSQFHSNDFINRTFYDDYIDIMHRFQVVRWETMFNSLPFDHLRRLRALYPGRGDFSTYGACCKLLV